MHIPKGHPLIVRQTIRPVNYRPDTRYSQLDFLIPEALSKRANWMR